MTTRTSKRRGTVLQGLAATMEKSSKPRKRFPHDGSGSMTPSPSILKVASVKMNTGMAIQNCANRTGRRLGSTCRKTILQRVHPAARANSRKSELRRSREAAQTTRKAEDQPSRPSSKKVAMIDTTGEMSRGNAARKATRTRSEERRVGKEGRERG